MADNQHYVIDDGQNKIPGYSKEETDAAIDAAASNLSNLADAYDATKTYAVGDWCIYNSVLYQCKTAITTAEAWNAAHWQQMTVTEAIGDAIKTDELIIINSQQTTNADGNIDSNVFVSGGYSDNNYAVLSAVVVDNNNACVLVGNYNGRFVFSIKSRNDLSKISNFSLTIRIVLCKTPYLTV